jgi:UDP-N-acetylglucosamine 2-epimerase (non-hydrolysing)
MKILHVVGARPNFMKIAPIMHEMEKHSKQLEQLLVHTGQHYDDNMSRMFFDDLELPHPDVNLEVGSGSHATQTAKAMLRFEPVVNHYQPDWVIVVGDVNSTLACALVSAKLGVRVAHVEAGLRSFDRTMPEEYNRVLTDHICDLLLTPSEDANANLKREGISQERIFLVGNVMIDSLVHLLPKGEQRWDTWRERYKLERFMLVTLHRPSNVDDPMVLQGIMSALAEISADIPVIFPVHPRTRQRLTEVANWRSNQGALYLVEPLRYLDFLSLEIHASLVLTDSGGVQEETTYLGVPCLTARPNTERPVTLTHGTNRLVKSNREALVDAIQTALATRVLVSPTIRPRLWDGKSAERIVRIIQSFV